MAEYCGFFTACGVGNQITPILSRKVGVGVCWGQSPDGSTSDNFMRRYSSGGTVYSVEVR